MSEVCEQRASVSKQLFMLYMKRMDIMASHDVSRGSDSINYS